MKTKNQEGKLKTYNFKCGISASQDELSYKQSKQLLKELKALKIESLDEVTKMTIADLIDTIADSDLIPAVINVILSPCHSEGAKRPKNPEQRDEESSPDYSNLTVSEISEVFEDFFSINPALPRLFGIGKGVLNSIPISTVN